MDESNNLFATLQAILRMKTAVVEPPTSSEPEPSTPSTRQQLHASDQSSPTKKRCLEHSVQKFVGNIFSTVSIPTRDAIDLNVFLNSARNKICNVISNELVERKTLKFYLAVNPELEGISTEGVEVSSAPYLHSLPNVVPESSDLEKQYQSVSDRLKHLLQVFQEEGSGFTLKSVQGCTMNVATFDVVGGSFFIELPPYIKNKIACVNSRTRMTNVFYFACVTLGNQLHRTQIIRVFIKKICRTSMLTGLNTRCK